MVIDILKNAPLYYGISKRIEEGLKYLQRTDFSKIEPGKYNIDGENIYANVGKQKSKATGKLVLEAHKQHIDIHYMVKGTEKVGYANLKDMKITKGYVEKEDYLLGEGHPDFFLLSEGTFAIMFPDDAHMPCVAVIEPEDVTRVVVKLLV